MWKLILLLLLSGCASTVPEASGSLPETSGFSPVIYVIYHGPVPDRPCVHVRPDEVILDPDWPPTICLPDKRSR